MLSCLLIYCCCFLKRKRREKPSLNKSKGWVIHSARSNLCHKRHKLPEFSQKICRLFLLPTSEWTLRMWSFRELFLAICQRRHADLVFENGWKVVGIVESDRKCDIGDGERWKFQKPFCLVDAQTDQIFAETFAHGIFEGMAEVGAAAREYLTNGIRGDIGCVVLSYVA